MSGFAWVTLATNDSYSLGALVLANSLRQVGTAHQLAVLITPGVSPTMREQLASVFDTVQEVNVLDSNDESNLALLARPDLGITFTKLHCWTLTQYAKCVFLDADTLVLQPCDELFDRNELSAAPDVGWPDCFNSGVFVYRPSLETFRSILDLALSRGSFDGGDQGLLNLYFNDWSTQDASRRLPFIYNMCSTACYSYLPAFKQFGSEAKIVHFIGAVKPWLLELDTQTGLVNAGSGGEHLRGLLQRWWSLFLSQVLPKLRPDMCGMAGALAQLSIGSPRSEQQVALEEHWRRQAWEHGHIDYLGKDAFDKIWAKIVDTLTISAPPTESTDASSQPPAGSPGESLPAPEAVTTPTEPLDEPVSSVLNTLPVQPLLATEPTALPTPIADLPPVLATEPTALPTPIADLPTVLATEPIALPTPIAELPPVLATEPIALPTPIADLPPVLATEPIALPTPIADLPPVPDPIQCAKPASVPSPSLVPRTPTVTDATPPTSPPIGPLSAPPSPRALGVGSVTPPETPPVGSTGNLQGAAANQSDAEAAPIPPKRRGGPNKGGKAAVQKAKK